MQEPKMCDAPHCPKQATHHGIGRWAAMEGPTTGYRFCDDHAHYMVKR